MVSGFEIRRQRRRRPSRDVAPRPGSLVPKHEAVIPIRGCCRRPLPVLQLSLPLDGRPAKERRKHGVGQAHTRQNLRRRPPGRCLDIGALPLRRRDGHRAAQRSLERDGETAKVVAVVPAALGFRWSAGSDDGEGWQVPRTRERPAPVVVATQEMTVLSCLQAAAIRERRKQAVASAPREIAARVVGERLGRKKRIGHSTLGPIKLAHAVVEVVVVVVVFPVATATVADVETRAGEWMQDVEAQHFSFFSSFS